MKKLYILFSLIAAVTFTACSKQDAAAPTEITTNLVASVNGQQQVPANNSMATGSFTGTYTSSTRVLTYTVTYQGITPQSAHIHNSSGAVAIPFVNLASPIMGSLTLTNDQATDLLGNGMYVNIHSAAFPAGEIRGNIHKQ